MMINTPCTKTIKDEAMSQHLNNANVQESDSIPLLELDTNTSPINFNSDTGIDSTDAHESLHKKTDENNQPKSPSILSRPYVRKQSRLKQFRLAFYPAVKNNEKNMRCKDRAKLNGRDCWTS